MKSEIPIVITTKGQMGGDLVFKLASPLLLQAFKKIRIPSAQKVYHNETEYKHHTLDLDTQRHSARTRRISSSAASKRFPKDFFKDENCFHPIKSNRSHHKQYQQDFFDTFGHKLLPIYQPNSKKEEANLKQFDTPKFVKKCENSQSNKTRLNNHLSHQKLQRLKMKEKYSMNSLMQIKSIKSPLVQINQQLFDKPFISPIPLVSNFNLTLGQKGSLFPLQKAEKLKRERQIDEKQNNHYPTGSKTSRPINHPKRYGVFRIQRKAFVQG